MLLKMQLADTTRAELSAMQPTIKVNGLYYMYEGERRTPKKIWFGCDLRELHDNGYEYGGKAYCYYDNALRPVFMSNGQRFVRPELRNVSGYYDGTTIKDMYVG